MIKPAIPEQEDQRVKALLEYEILDTLPEQIFDDLTKIAAAICGTPISLVSLVDPTRQWFKSRHGLDATETPRELAFCAHAINSPDEVLIVPDASKDKRFFDNPLSTGAPNVMFYAGAPLVDAKGLAMGTLCVIDHEPREVTKNQLDSLKALARQVMSLMELRKSAILEAEKTKELEVYKKFFTMNIDLICIAGTDGYFKKLNPAFSQVLKWSMDELLSKPFFDFIHPDDIPATIAEIEKLAKGNPTIGFQNRFKCKDGSYLIFDWTATPDHKTGELFAVAHNISELKSIQDKLAYNEEQFRNAIESAPNGMLMINADGNIVMVNNQIEKLFDYQKDELIGNKIEMLIPERFRKKHSKLREGYIKNSAQRTMGAGRELFGLKKGGSEFPIDIGLNPMKTSQGDFVLSSIMDITERKKAEEEKKQFEKFFTMSLDMVCVAGTNGYFRKLNPAFTKVLGFTIDELLSKPFVEFIHPDDISDTLAEVEKLASGVPTIGFINRYQCKDGSYKIIDWTATPDPKTGELFAVAHDITELKETQEQFKKLSMNFEGQLEAINRSAAKVELDMDGNILEVNQNFLNLFEYKKDELIHQHHRILVESDYLKSRKYKEFWIDLKAGKFLRGEFKLLSKSGKTIWINGSYNPVFDLSGKPCKVVKLAYDVTPQKEAEFTIKEYADNLQLINNELDQFAYVVSHDLKAPLRGISTIATFMNEDYADKLDDDGREQLRLMLNRVDRMNNLINGILQYSRIGRVKQEKEVVDLKSMIHQIADLIVPSDKFEFKVTGNLPTLKIERVLIEQIFQNLISNAVKYNDKPKGKIEIGCEEESKFWEFSVADNGPGIDEKYHQKIFVIFQTLHAKDVYESTGIGLSLVKKTIDNWGGKIWVESEPGKGTSFIFTVPKKMK